MPDLDLEIREARSFRPPGGWGAVSKTFFSALQAPFWSKNKEGERAPWAPSLDPLLEGMHH